MNNCLLCKFWEVTATERSMAATEPTIVGECRRRSPIPNTAAPAYDQSTGSYKAAMWPFTQANDWCGDFKRRQQ